MSFKDNQDLRVRGNGGWAYAEHELWSVFAPLIGPAGVSVYMALCRLVPWAGVNSDVRVTVRSISEASCVGRSKCAELMQTIFKLGMVTQTNYLDGRDPSYKLTSLNALAKLGHKELLERIGVRNTDTAPFDQSFKHKRERSVRVQETREERADDQQSRPLPLLESASDDENVGVRHTDTGEEDTSGAFGVRNTDTVSAKTAFVSTKTASVSANSAFVSTGADTFKEEKRSEELKDLNPLPPDKQGGVDLPEGLGEPVLPTARPTIADPAFKASLPYATRWVMAELGITKNRLVDVVSKQLELWCKQHRSEPLEAAAALMVRQGKELHTNAQLMRHHPWGWQRFFAEGHWQRPLPYESPARAREAAMLESTDEHVEPPIHAEKAAAWIEKNATLLGDLGFDNFAVRLRELAQNDVPLDGLDRALNVIEDELCAYLVDGAERTDLAQIRKECDAQFADHRKRMTAAQFERLRHQVLTKRVMEAAGVPRLSLFYLPQH